MKIFVALLVIVLVITFVGGEKQKKQDRYKKKDHKQERGYKKNNGEKGEYGPSSFNKNGFEREHGRYGPGKEIPSEEQINQPEPCPYQQGRVCTYTCPILTCANYEDQKANWTTCLHETYNGYVFPLNNHCLYGSSQWSDCMCTAGFIIDEGSKTCVRGDKCSQTATSTTPKPVASIERYWNFT